MIHKSINFMVITVSVLRSAVTMRLDLVIVDGSVEITTRRFIHYKDRFFIKTFIIHQNITYLIKS